MNKKDVQAFTIPAGEYRAGQIIDLGPAIEFTNVPEWIGDEREALLKLTEIGRIHGYGNCISHLMREWQKHLMAHGLTKGVARKHVCGATPYPLDHHDPESA